MPPVAAPAAAETADAVSSAFASNLPVNVNNAPTPMLAREPTFEIEIAIDGTIAIGPAAPVRDSVVIACCPFARNVRSCALSKMPPSSTPAKVESLTIESANETPRPKLEPPIVPPNAFTVETLVDAAESDTSPVVDTEPPERIAAVVLTLTMLIDTEPATPIEPPPAPDIDSAPKRLVTSPATSVIDAAAAKPAATTNAPDSTTDSLVTFAKLIATPAPIATPEPPVAALPSAVAFASELTELLRVSVPPAVT